MEYVLCITYYMLCIMYLIYMYYVSDMYVIYIYICITYYMLCIMLLCYVLRITLYHASSMCYASDALHHVSCIM